MSSRERVRLALEHQEPDCVPLDLGATTVTGMHVDTVYRLRQALDLDAPGTPVKVIEPFQMLGEIKPDLLNALAIDTALRERHGDGVRLPAGRMERVENLRRHAGVGAGRV